LERRLEDLINPLITLRSHKVLGLQTCSAIYSEKFSVV
jgi:hypothetical protein